MNIEKRRKLISKEFLTLDMDIQIIKVTDKGQISLPQKFRKTVGIQRGDKIIAIQEGNTIILQSLDEDKFKDLVKHSQKVAKKLWSHKEDDIWNNV